VSEIKGADAQLRAFTSAKFPYGGFVLGLSQFSLPPQLPHKMTLNLKVIIFD